MVSYKKQLDDLVDRYIREKECMCCHKKGEGVPNGYATLGVAYIRCTLCPECAKKIADDEKKITISVSGEKRQPMTNWDCPIPTQIGQRIMRW